MTKQIYCEKPCEEYRIFKEKNPHIVADVISSFEFRTYQKKLANYCKYDCPRPSEKGKTLSQKL